MEDLKEHIGTVIIIIGTMWGIIGVLMGIVIYYVKRDLAKFPAWIAEMEKKHGVLSNDDTVALVRGTVQNSQNDLMEYVRAEFLKVRTSIENNYMKKQDIDLCGALRAGCQAVMHSKLDGIVLQLKNIAEQNVNMMTRLDVHIDHSAKGE
jgi:hypothetical protein